VLVGQARRHLDSARAIAAGDPVGGYQLLYDAAGKALAAVLENQGLRATRRDGHIAVRDAVSALLDPPLGTGRVVKFGSAVVPQPGARGW
jgi:hypothetical protein